MKDIFEIITVENIHKCEEGAVALGVSVSSIVWIFKIAAQDTIDALWDIREKRRERAKGKRDEARRHHGPHGGAK